MDLQRFTQDRLDGHARIQRTDGILKHHLHLFAQRAEFLLRQREHLAIAIHDSAAGDGHEFEQSTRHRGLATAAFTDKPHRAALRDLEADLVHGLDNIGGTAKPTAAHGEVNFEVLNAEQRHVEVSILAQVRKRAKVSLLGKHESVSIRVR